MKKRILSRLVAAFLLLLSLSGCFFSVGGYGYGHGHGRGHGWGHHRH